MNKFVRNLITEWRKIGLPFAGEKKIIAVSGGADSVSLALAIAELRDLKKLENHFAVAHFNHKLRGRESDADEEFVRNLAEKLNFDFYSGFPENPLQVSKKNLEQAARIARYDFLETTARDIGAKFVLTAHTKNDQAETFLFNLLRGSGISGLAAMPVIKESDSLNSSESQKSNKSEITSPKSRIKQVRPLLRWAEREETEEFCRLKKKSFRLDEMNKDLKFSRVRIRRELIPFLKTFNPRIIRTLAETASLMQSESVLYETRESLPEKLSVKGLAEMTQTERANVLRTWLKQRRGTLRQLGKVHISNVENLILSRKSGRFVELPDDERVIKGGGKLYFEKSKVEKTDGDN